MELDVVPNRALTDLLVRAITGSSSGAPSRRGPYAPPSCPAHTTPLDDLRSDAITNLCRTLLAKLLVGDDHIVGVVDELAPDVVLWTPTCFASTSTSALEILLSNEWDTSPLSDRTITITNTDIAPPRVFVEWRIAGRFTHPFFLADDLLIDPTGQLVETAGVLVVTFDAEGVAAMHLYHDPLAILEQLLTPR